MSPGDMVYVNLPKGRSLKMEGWQGEALDTRPGLSRSPRGWCQVHLVGQRFRAEYLGPIGKDEAMIAFYLDHRATVVRVLRQDLVLLEGATDE